MIQKGRLSLNEVRGGGQNCKLKNFHNKNFFENIKTRNAKINLNFKTYNRL